MHDYNIQLQSILNGARVTTITNSPGRREGDRTLSGGLKRPKLE